MGIYTQHLKQLLWQRRKKDRGTRGGGDDTILLLSPQAFLGSCDPPSRENYPDSSLCPPLPHPILPPAAPPPSPHCCHSRFPNSFLTWVRARTSQEVPLPPCSPPPPPHWVLPKASRAARTLQETILITSLHLIETSQWLPFALRTK